MDGVGKLFPEGQKPFAPAIGTEKALAASTFEHRTDQHGGGQRLDAATDWFFRSNPGVFDADDVEILLQAYDEACAFLGGDIRHAQRRAIASSILNHAKRGVRDPHRLAIKAIVSV